MKTEERKYKEIFESMCLSLQARRREDPTFTLDELRGMLETQYIRQGNDLDGRGKMGDVRISALIAAHEHVLAEWEKDEASNAARGG